VKLKNDNSLLTKGKIKASQIVVAYSFCAEGITNGLDDLNVPIRQG